MAAKSVVREHTISADTYYEIDGQLDEIKRQLRQKTGYPHDLSALKRALHLIIIGEFRPPPKRAYPEYIPLRDRVITDDPFAAVRMARREAPRSMIYKDYLWKRSFARRVVNGDA